MLKKSNLTNEDKEELTNKITGKVFTNDLNHPHVIKFKE